MKYYITLMSTAGVIEEHSLELNIDRNIKWIDFVNLLPVQTLLRERPTLELLDITPEDMVDAMTTTELDETLQEDEEND